MWNRIKRIFRSFLPDKSSLSLGELGELAAVKYLRKKKYKVVDRNVSFHEGEIDIVAVDNKTVVFVEVKTRKNTDKGEPWEAVDFSKQKKLQAAASIYLNREGLNEQSYRYDIISVLWPDENQPPQIEHLENAFGESGN